MMGYFGFRKEWVWYRAHFAFVMFHGIYFVSCSDIILVYFVVSITRNINPLQEQREGNEYWDICVSSTLRLRK